MASSFFSFLFFFSFFFLYHSYLPFYIFIYFFFGWVYSLHMQGMFKNNSISSILRNLDFRINSIFNKKYSLNCETQDEICLPYKCWKNFLDLLQLDKTLVAAFSPEFKFQIK
jgi:hypothetical protein